MPKSKKGKGKKSPLPRYPELRSLAADMAVAAHLAPFIPSDGGSNRTEAATIRSPSNPFVKHCVKLRLSSSYRYSHSSALLLGLTPISEILRFEDRKKGEIDDLVECLMLLDGLEMPSLGVKASSRVVRVSSAVMRKVSGLKSADSMEAIGIMRFPKSFRRLDGDDGDCLSWFNCRPHRILVLDGIQDPGNLGTLLRSAMAFKWDGVFLLPGCCDPFNDKALRSARGASFQLPIVLGSWGHLESLVDNFKMKMIAAHPGESEKSSNLSEIIAGRLADKSICLILGSEGQGLSEQSKGVCELVNIPMEGSFESLNVSVAGGILLFMLQRRTCVGD